MLFWFNFTTPYKMIVFYVFLATLIAILGISSYSYEKVDPITGNSNVSQKLLLTTLIITSVVVFAAFFLRFIDYIDLERGSNVLSFGTLVTSILLILSYSYLDKERQSSAEYETKKNELQAVEDNTNSKERDMSLIMGTIGLGIVGAYLFILLGKVFYSKKITTTITVKEPLIIEPISEKPVKLDYDQLRKKFVV